MSLIFENSSVQHLATTCRIETIVLFVAVSNAVALGVGLRWIGRSRKHPVTTNGSMPRLST
jgi:hypothetical protein